MTVLSVFIDVATEKRLRKISAETGRPIDELAESAVEEEALNAFRDRHDDPAKDPA